jgi:hypothetical protein
MNIFDVHEEIINDYSSYIESFVNIKNDFIRGNVEGEISSGKLWPQPLIQFNPLYKKLISDFEDKSICRADVIPAFKEYYSSQGDAMRAFMLTMVWGFSDTGYGTHRANTYISVPSNIELIKKAIDSVKQSDLKSAFNDLKKIKGLGVSYITKALYFATRGVEQSNYA